jgi:hypothetical protein
MRSFFVLATMLSVLLCESGAHGQAIASRCDSVNNSSETAAASTPLEAAVPKENPTPTPGEIAQTYQTVTTSISNFFSYHLSFADHAWTRAEQMSQDLSLLFELRYHQSRHCKTDRKIIQPWVVHYHPGMKPEEIRATYNLCEFIQDAGTQIPRDPRESGTCVTLGDDRGYTLGELQQRFGMLNTTVEDLKLAINGGVVAGSVATALLTRGFFKQFPILVLGSVTLRNLIAVVPTGAFGTYFVVSDSAEVPIRHLVDMRNAFKITAEGRFVKNDSGSAIVSVEMPIQTFAPILEEYLNSIHSKNQPIASR